MEKKKQIKLKYGLNEQLRGKVIENLSFVTDHTEPSDNQLLITFTDNTFIAIGIDEDNDSVTLEESWCPELHNYGKLPPHFITKDNKVHFCGKIQYQMDLGIIEPMSEENLTKLVEEDKRERRERKYKEYLELKKMFENEEKEN